MIPLRLGEVADIVGGAVYDDDGADPLVHGPAFLDSRRPEAGGLFAAFAGEEVDGHRFAADAIAGGATAVLGSRPTGEPTVVVGDVRAALQDLAREVLRRLRAQGAPRVAAITGSQGKTTVKDMLAAVLAGPHTVATRGSLNNELGLPLTVLRSGSATQRLLLEMGARGIGHIAELCAIAPPDVSVVLNVGRAHLGEFGSRENIALAKGELVEALGRDGVAVLNADDPMVLAMAERTRGRVMTFGRAPAADVRLSDVVLDELGRPGFTLTGPPAHGDGRARVQLRLLGAHQADNAAAVAAAVLALGGTLEEVASRLGELAAVSRWRMELSERADGLVVVNDAYNANPDSMASALRTLAELGRRSGRRTVAVLGPMLELGPDSAAEHAGIGRLTAELGIDEVVAVGAEARAMVDGRPRSARGAARHLDAVSDTIEWLGNNVQRTDVVLVKASRGARLERVADALLSEAPAHGA